ncbi:hypothetical protein [Aureimonas populi]|uniref:Uncharacterized protein n=1 Tax=Aureimonas populi TaxID=1701758 RepID=A0ABW5CM96_9HYPH|nr:hypothetical protein [Aureimonas populi]
MRTVAVLAGLLALGACQTQGMPSSYDIYASEYRDGSGNRCVQYAYESGRSRYEFERSVTGQAYAASNANAEAERAFRWCKARRPA